MVKPPGERRRQRRLGVLAVLPLLQLVLLRKAGASAGSGRWSAGRGFAVLLHCQGVVDAERAAVLNARITSEQEGLGAVLKTVKTESGALLCPPAGRPGRPAQPPPGIAAPRGPAPKSSIQR